MHVVCLQENLSRGLGIVGRAVATRSTLPITSHVLLETDGGRLKLAATDLSIALTCWVGAQVEEEGSITVPSRLITEFVGSLPAAPIDLVLAPRSRQVRLSCARNEANMSGLDAEDFPPFPAVEGGPTIELDPETLRRAITLVGFAAATDDSRPVLTGVHTLIEGSTLTLAAADGFRLAVCKIELAKAAPGRTEIIIPARALQELGRLLSDTTEPVTMVVNEAHTQVMFRLPDIEMKAQLVLGTFPNYNQLIPETSTTRASVSVAEFLREVRIASIFARDGSGIVRLQITTGSAGAPGRLIISARAEEIGDNQGEIDSTVEGEESKIAFNGRYLQEVLSVLDAGQVVLETTGPSSPGVLRPAGAQGYVHVVMPMFVQW
ncbi:MAG: DNA polymerase III subunit beta [Dehalococcoidia bacterium]|nr:DNA polymerase III subunit beta [Dehalococcoidia bacterium]